MINGSVTKPVEVLNERETMQHFVDGGKKAISAAKELAKSTANPDWINAAETLEAMVEGCQKLADMRSMNRLETLMAASLKANPKGFIH